MRKISSFLLVLVLVFAFASCAVPANVSSVPTSADESSLPTDSQDEKPAVITISEDEVLYFCEQCQGECSYYTGYFRCPSVDRTSGDALAINDEIRRNYDKYMAVAKAVDDSGLAYGFNFTQYADAKYAIVRTAVETVMLHNGGTYSYHIYYYDLENDCKADVADVCGHFEMQADVIAAFVMLVLEEAGTYSESQLQSVCADCLDLYPLGNNSYYVRVQNDQLKYECTLDADDLNSRGEEIASLMMQSEESDESATDENGETVSEEPTIEQDVIYMEY